MIVPGTPPGEGVGASAVRPAPISLDQTIGEERRVSRRGGCRGEEGVKGTSRSVTSSRTPRVEEQGLDVGPGEDQRPINCSRSTRWPCRGIAIGT
jgi:hypothetical protein